MTDHEIEEVVLRLVRDRQRKVAFVIAAVSEEAGNRDNLFHERVATVIEHLLATRVLRAVGDMTSWRHSEIVRAV